jgi:NAD(P)-dependent dehydrogenase (short-subunit alcohol dehydrogenase family)
MWLRRGRSKPISAVASFATILLSTRMIAENTALGRAGLPEDLGPMIASLLSEENHWVNAQRIEVAGGVAI